MPSVPATPSQAPSPPPARAKEPPHSLATLPPFLRPSFQANSPPPLSPSRPSTVLSIARIRSVPLVFSSCLSRPPSLRPCPRSPPSAPPSVFPARRPSIRALRARRSLSSFRLGPCPPCRCPALPLPLPLSRPPSLPCSHVPASPPSWRPYVPCSLAPSALPSLRPSSFLSCLCELALPYPLRSRAFLVTFALFSRADF